jgi:photosystem II stability/assembly factor-like uncharacterized protein
MAGLGGFHDVGGSGAEVYAVGEGGAIVRSADAGRTWTLESSADAGIASVLYLTCDTGALVVALGEKTGLRSTDQGNSWSATGPLITGGVDNFLLGPGNDPHGYKYGFLACAGGALFTGDWASSKQITSADHQYVARSTNGGLDWSQWFAPDGRVWAFAATASGFVAAGESKGIPAAWTSSDGGATWTALPPTGKQGAILEVWAADIDDIWAVTGELILHYH